MSCELRTVTGEVGLIQFQAKYARWVSIYLNVPDGVQSHYQLVPGYPITVDGKSVDSMGLIAWANVIPPSGGLLIVNVEMKVADNDYVGVHEANFTSSIRPSTGSTMSEKFCTTAPLPATMKAVGLDWSGVRVYAAKSIKLIQDHGDEFLDLIDAGFKAFTAVTGRDFVGVFAAINAAQRDLQAIIAAIKLEFDL